MDSLTENEMVEIINNFLKHRGKRGATEDEIRAVIKSLEHMIFDANLVALVRQGFVEISDLVDGELVFKPGREVVR